MPLREQPIKPTIQTHRLPQVAAPVLRIELRPLQRFARHRREHPDRGGAGLHAVQSLLQLPEDAVHLRAVRGVVHIHPTAEHPLFRAAADELFDRLAVPRNHRRRRRVDDRYRKREPVPLQ